MALFLLNLRFNALIDLPTEADIAGDGIECLEGSLLHCNVSEFSSCNF